ncbi:MAG TPA: hypothetical protein VMZ91_15875 [Candidatus Paceibacterota bacterium]|nr:hypothetical protein [Candidatus Paceibacterota bacterium]
MENKNQNKKPKVVFTNCKNYGENIKALVIYYTNNPISTFVLERAIEEIKKNEEQIKALTNKLLK